MKTEWVTWNQGVINKNYHDQIWTKIKRVSSGLTNIITNFDDEMEILSLLKNKKITVPVIETKIDLNQQFILITKYISNTKTWDQIKTINNEKTINNYLKRVADTLQKLQKIPIITTSISKWDKKNKLKLFLGLINQNDQLSLLPFVKLIQTWLDTPITSFVLSHNDLSGGNLLFTDNECYIIDFEYATLNHPLADVASFLNESLNDAQSMKTWLSLFGIDSNDQKNELWYWIIYERIIWSAWALYLYKQTQKKLFKTIFDYFKTGLETNRFKNVIFK